MRILRRIVIVVSAIVAVLLLAPIWAHMGETTEIARWTSPASLYGMKRPIWLEIERNVAYVDIFSLYPSYRLYITDGGYAYARDFDVPNTDFKSYLAHCQVVWQTNGAEFITPDADRYFIPGQLIRSRIGTD